MNASRNLGVLTVFFLFLENELFYNEIVLENMLMRWVHGEELASQLKSGTAEFIRSNITRLSNSTLFEAGYTDLLLVEHISIIDAPHLVYIDVDHLKLMPNLKTFSISQAPRLERIDKLPPMPSLRVFIVMTSGLTVVPDLSHVLDTKKKLNSSYDLLRIVDLEGNHIRHIPKHALRINADQVSLNLNLIEEVPAHAFKFAKINKLSFRGNTKLKRIDPHAFTGLLFLKQLDLGSTAVTSIPTSGLETLEILKIDKTPSLKYIPSIYDLKNLQTATLTHHFHCCAFRYPEIHDPRKHATHLENAAHMQKKCEENKRKNEELRKLHRRRRSLEPIRTITYGRRTNVESEYIEDTATTVEDSPESSESDEYSDFGPDYMDDNFHDSSVNNTVASVEVDCTSFSKRPKVNCTPEPDALNPCEDVMGWTWLRASVWFVISAAVVGNTAVLVVLLTNHAELTVARFLMCHLAFSDLCTGLYLFMLAVVDLKSFGEFFNYAYDWQYGLGCKIAGFLTVFSGQLSVFTLTIVTLERWFAITYAIYLERRISLAAAAKIMISGWIFSTIMAGLPLFGVSDYSSTSICLPVESDNIGVAVYQGSLFMTNAVAWVMIVICYVQIYRSLGGGGEKYGGRGSAAAAERKIANKMALLIGTDLLCWAPVAFFGVTALVGVPLVDVSHGKVLLVFFYPLNACANPFLYAILTKQYRSDLMKLIARTGKCNWLVERYKLAATPPATAHTNPSAPATLPLVEYQRENSQISKNSDAML